MGTAASSNTSGASHGESGGSVNQMTHPELRALLLQYGYYGKIPINLKNFKEIVNTAITPDGIINTSIIRNQMRGYEKPKQSSVNQMTHSELRALLRRVGYYDFVPINLKKFKEFVNTAITRDGNINTSKIKQQMIGYRQPVQKTGNLSTIPA